MRNDLFMAGPIHILMRRDLDLITNIEGTIRGGWEEDFAKDEGQEEGVICMKAMVGLEQI